MSDTVLGPLFFYGMVTVTLFIAGSYMAWMYTYEGIPDRGLARIAARATLLCWAWPVLAVLVIVVGAYQLLRFLGRAARSADD